MQDILAKAYDPEQFREKGHQLIDQLADYLSAVQKGKHYPTTKWEPPQDAYAKWEDKFESSDSFQPDAFYKEMIEESIHLHHPKYMGHQICPPLPEAALASLAGDLLNNGMGVYEMGQAATAMERVLIKAVANKFGFDDQADGLLDLRGNPGKFDCFINRPKYQSETAGMERRADRQISLDGFRTGALLRRSGGPDYGLG